MIIECKKGSSALLAVVLLTSLNCLASEEYAPAPDQNFSSRGGIQKPAPSFARNFYTNFRAYGPATGTAIGTGYCWSRWNIGYEPVKNPVLYGWGTTALLTSYGQYKKRQEQDPKERETKLWYFAPAATTVAFSSLVGLGYCAYNGETAAKNLLNATIEGAKKGAFLAALPAITGACALGKEYLDDVARAIMQDKIARQKRTQEKGKEEEKVEEAYAVN